MNSASPICLALLSITFSITGCVATDFSEAYASLSEECSRYPLNRMLGATCYFNAEPDMQVPWSQSMANCEAEGGKLAHIFTQTDYVKIYEAFAEQFVQNNLEEAWIGVKGEEQSTTQDESEYINYWMQSATQRGDSLGVRTMDALGPSSTYYAAGRHVCGKISFMPPMASPQVMAGPCNSDGIGHLCMKTMPGQQYALVKSGEKFEGAALQTSTEETERHCAFSCMQNGLCLAFNYGAVEPGGAGGGMCLLYAEKPSLDIASTFTINAGFNYYQRVA